MSNNPNFHTYTDADLAYVKEQHGAKSMADIAEHIGVTVWALKRKLTAWRNSGEDIPKVQTKKASDIGTISHWVIDGKTISVVKTENGWRYVRAPKKEVVKTEKPAKKPKGIVVRAPKVEKPAREIVVKKPKPPKQKKPQSGAPCKPVKKYADRIHTQKVSFRIDSKTVVMIDPGADREEVIQKYKKAI